MRIVHLRQKPVGLDRIPYGYAPRCLSLRSFSDLGRGSRGLVQLAFAVSMFVCCQGWIRPIAAKPSPKPKAAQKRTQSRPQLAYERFRSEVQFEVAEKREAQISGLRRLLALGATESEAPDLKFRLAELYSDKSRYYFFQGQELEEEVLRAPGSVDKKSLNTSRRQALDESRLWAKEALRVYDEIQREYPQYPRMPEVLFALGQSLWTNGSTKSALQPYAELIRKYPENPLIAEAWVAFGEYYFEAGNIRKALQSYQNAAEMKRSRVYGFALYKQAWCYFNMAEWQQALRKFEATVLFSQLSEEMSGENKLALGREAQRDWVRTYVHTGEADQARQEIARLLDLDRCEGRCLALLDSLAGRWYDEGYFGESARIYRQLVSLDSTSFRNPFRQSRVVDLADRMGDKTQTLQAAKRFARVLSQVRKQFEVLPDGAKEKIVAEGDLQEAELVSENTIRRIAQEWNKEARKTNTKKTFELAQSMYAIFLRSFSSSEFSYDIQFEYADLLYKNEKFDAAAKAYRKVVETKPDGKHRLEAANDNILAVDEHLRDLGVELPTDLKEKRPFHPQHQRLVDACQRYLSLVPTRKKGPKEAVVRLKVARVFYAYNHFQEAISRFDVLVAEHPRSEQAVVAANLAVDIYNLKKDWHALYDAAKRYREQSALVAGRPELKQALMRFGEYAKFALVQELEDRTKTERGDLRQVAKGYEEFYREFPKSENADEALFNASVIWDRVGSKARAGKLRTTLLREYRNSPLRADVAFYVAKRYQERTQYQQAAAALAAFAREFPEDNRAADALYDASVFYAGTGQPQSAAKVRNDYIATYGKQKRLRSELVEIAYAQANDLEQARRYRQAADAYGEFFKKYPRDDRAYDAQWRQAQIRADKLRQKRQADEIKKKLLGAVNWRLSKKQRVPPNALRHASWIAFERIKEDDKTYRRMRLKAPSLRSPRPFQKSLREKARARDRLVKRYTGIVTKYRQAESSIASLYKIAEAWDIFVKDLLRVPCPRGVSREICGEMKGQLQQMSLPAQQSALQAYQACVSESYKLEAFTRYSTRCSRQLERRAPQLVSPLVERVVAMDRLDSVPASFGPTHPLLLDQRETDGAETARRRPPRKRGDDDRLPL